MMVNYKNVYFFLRDDNGVTAMEYALIGALVSVFIILAITAVGTHIQAKYQYVADSMPP